MPRKAVFIHGSPRKRGNTRALAQVAAEALKELDIDSDFIDVPRLEFKKPGCIACYKCQGSPDFGCHVDDELAKAVRTLPKYDALVLATPVYWFSYPAQVKMFVDRMFSMIKFDEKHEILSPLRGKPLALLATGGGALEDNLSELERQWRIPAGRIGSPFLSMLFPMCHYAPGAVVEDPAPVAKAHAFGLKLGEMVLNA